MFKKIKDLFKKEDENENIENSHEELAQIINEEEEPSDKGDQEDNKSEDIRVDEYDELQKESEIKENNDREELLLGDEELIQKDEVIEGEVEAPIEEKKPESFFYSLKSGMSKTRKDISSKINSILGNVVKIDDDLLEELEEILISADVGMNTTVEIIDNLRDTIKDQNVQDAQMVKPLLKEEILKIIDREEFSREVSNVSPSVILVVGVNGVGKTTTIGKLAHKYRDQGKRVLIAAGDTFRAAAIDQLKTWVERSATDVISHTEGSDPAAVIFDAIQASKARNIDILICDTAGRLHNKSNLMKELSKISRIIEREYPEAEKETLLVLDATTGQNALSQAKEFNEAADITGIVLTKLDGTAKGGIAIALQNEFNIPIKLIGVGESINDLQSFNAKNFINVIIE